MDFLPFGWWKSLGRSEECQVEVAFLTATLQESWKGLKKNEPELMNNYERCTTHILCNLYNQPFNVVMLYFAFSATKTNHHLQWFFVPLHLLNISSRTTWYAHVVGPIPAVHNFWQSVKRWLSIYHLNINLFSTPQNGSKWNLMDLSNMTCYLYVTKKKSYVSLLSKNQLISILDVQTLHIKPLRHEKSTKIDWCFGVHLYSLAFFEYIWGWDPCAT